MGASGCLTYDASMSDLDFDDLDLSSWPPAPALATRARILRDLDAASVDEAFLRRFPDLPGGSGEWQVFVARSGGGDHAVLWVRPERALLKCFDHEEEHSPQEREDEQPDPCLVEGMPRELGHLLEGEVLGHPGWERTFCAWWSPVGGWETSQENPEEVSEFPGDLFLAEADEVGEWWSERRGSPLDGELLGALLQGERPWDAAARGELLPLDSGSPTVPLGLPGWRRGDPFHLVLLAAPVETASALLIKSLREVTGGSLGELRRALLQGGEVHGWELNRHDHLLRVREVRKLCEVLGAAAGFRLRVRLVGEDRSQDREIDLATLRSMAGSSWGM